MVKYEMILVLFLSLLFFSLLLGALKIGKYSSLDVTLIPSILDSFRSIAFQDDNGVLHLYAEHQASP